MHRAFQLMSQATLAKSHVVATALLQLVLLEPTRADDVKADECGLASVYSSLSEETASGEDTSAKNLTAAHRSLPFETMVLVENRENGHSAVVRITDRGPHVSGRIIDVSQAAAYELGFADLTKVRASRSCRFRKIDQPVKIDCCDAGNSSAPQSLAPFNRHLGLRTD